MSGVSEAPLAPSDLNSSEGAAVDRRYPLTGSQRSLWFLYKLSPELQGNFNIVFVARIRGGLVAATLQAALDELASRHEALRMRFYEATGDVTQGVSDERNVPLHVVEVAEWDERAVEALVEADR